MDNNFYKIKGVLEKYNINKYWHFSPQYYNAYIHKICGDYLYENSLAFKNSRYSWIKNFFWHTAAILIGALVSWTRSMVLYKHPQIIRKGVNIIACPFCGRYVWFKHLPELIEFPIRVVYHPLFHFDFFKKNTEEYDKNKVVPEFYRFNLQDIGRAFNLLFLSYRMLRNCAKELDDVFGIYTGKFSRIFVFPILYGGFMERFINGKINNNPNRIIWLFDYDYDYKYIIFNDIIHKLRGDDVTVQIQHGSFVTDSFGFCNPVCDYSLCCSNREKQVIDKENIFSSRIRVLGAPLQTFNDVKSQNMEHKYDILFLLTDTYGSCGQQQRDVLSVVDSMKYKIRLRYRPASKDVDKIYLKKYIGGTEESIGTSLTEDVEMAKIVVCFSEDALYTAIRCNKPIIYVRDIDIAKYYDVSIKSKYFHFIRSNDFCNVDLDFLIEHRQNCNYSNDDFVLNNFGYFRLEDIKLRLNSIIKEIQNSDGSSF